MTSRLGQPWNCHAKQGATPPTAPRRWTSHRGLGHTGQSQAGAVPATAVAPKRPQGITMLSRCSTTAKLQQFWWSCSSSGVFG